MTWIRVSSAHHAAEDAQEVEPVEGAPQENYREERSEQHFCASHHLHGNPMMRHEALCKQTKSLQADKISADVSHKIASTKNLCAPRHTKLQAHPLQAHKKLCAPHYTCSAGRGATKLLKNGPESLHRASMARWEWQGERASMARRK